MRAEDRAERSEFAVLTMLPKVSETAMMHVRSRRASLLLPAHDELLHVGRMIDVRAAAAVPSDLTATATGSDANMSSVWRY